MKWLVTGGLGVVGANFCMRIHADGGQVVVVDPGEAPRHDINAQIARADVLHRVGVQYLSISILAEVLRGCDAVLHAGASTGIPYSVSNPTDDWAQNVDGTRALLEALRLVPRPTVVLSSVKPYAVGDIPTRVVDHRRVFADGRAGINETCLLAPDEPYAASKLAQSALCVAYAKSYDLPVVTLRCSNLYAPAACHGPRHGWVTWFCISAATGRPLRIEGDGFQTRDILHGDDVNSAVLHAVESADRLRGCVFNVGGGAKNAISVTTAAAMLHALSGVEIVTGAPGRKNEDQCFITDHYAFTHATGWTPASGVHDGIRDVYSWARANQDALRAVYEGL